MAVLGATFGIPPHEKTLEFVAADDNAASQVVLVVLPEEELQDSELDDFFPVVLDLPESPPPASQSSELEFLPEEELQDSELEDFFPVVLDLPESPPPFSLLPAKEYC